MADKLSEEQTEKLLETLKDRFMKNMDRHKKLEWEQVAKQLEASPKKLWSLYQMEETGGEPDVVDLDTNNDGIFFIDCAAESPKGRRSVCYDHEALEARKQHKPKNSALNMAKEMGIELLNEEQYRELQKMGEFDKKTSSWVKPPPEIRKLGGAIFGDRRFEHVFIYHNGAESYYGARGFRGLLKI